ncbi:MAG: DUF4271 domain-containing protein [Chitinophagales bacterium]
MRIFFTTILIGIFFWGTSLEGQTTALPIDTVLLQDSSNLAKDSIKGLSPSPHDTLARIAFEDLPTDSLEQRYDIQPFKEGENDHLPFYVLLCIVGIFGYVRYNFFSYLKSVQQSFFNINLAQQFFEEHFYSVSPASFFLNVNTILIYSLLGFLSVRYLGKLEHINDIGLSGLVLGAVLLVSLSRYWFYRIAAYILPIEKTLLFYLFNMRIVNYVLAMVLIPLLLIFAFADNIYLQGTILLIGVVILSFVLYRCYRGFLIGGKVMVLNKFHFFVYLCTFEIAPILILYKIIGILLI